VICSDFWDARNKWFNIGLGLNLEVGDLEAIRNTNSNVDDCFRDMLKKWLRTSLRPTRSNIITVLREKTVGFNQLAEELESKGLKRDRVINRPGKVSTKLLMTKTSPARCQVKFKSVIKIGALMLILLLIVVIIWNAQEANVGQYEEGEHIKGSLFGDTVVKKLFTPIKIISGVMHPQDVAVNQRGEIIVAEARGHHISIFSPTGKELRSFGSRGSGPGQFIGSHGVTVDDDGNILVADSNNDRIQKFTSDSEHTTSVGSHGSNRLQFNFPISVAISPITKRIAIPDYFNHRVQILNPDLTFNSSIDSEGSGSGKIYHPHDVAFDNVENMYVVDTGNDRIQKFNLKGKYLRQFGKSGKDVGELAGPISIYIDNDSIMYVTESANHRISLFTLKGEFLTSFGSKGAGSGQFNYPCGITVDEQGRIYVADYYNDRIQVFAQLTKSPH
jgi:tripartite motif-containing protein 2/3/tripartite motif-containing protein 71